MIRQKLYDIIFEAETKEGRFFDLALLWMILISVLIVVLESVDSIGQNYSHIFLIVEWAFTIIFTIEYLLRLYCVEKPFNYAKSFFGLIDLFAIIPSFLGLIMTGGSSLLVIRGFRLIRVFRLLKLGRYVGEADVLKAALKSSRFKITVFLLAVSSLAISAGTIMYLIEGKDSDFTSIPKGVYWAIVTMTTVGYGDIVPKTIYGQMISSVLMIMGYGIIAVPTGIVSVELVEAHRNTPRNTEVCPHCLIEGHVEGSIFCRMCGKNL